MLRYFFSPFGRRGLIMEDIFILKTFIAHQETIIESSGLNVFERQIFIRTGQSYKVLKLNLNLILYFLLPGPQRPLRL